MRVAAVIERALQKGPEQRWPSAEAMAEALQNAAEPIRRPVTVERVPAEASPEPSAEPPRGIPGTLVVGAVLLAVLGGLGMVVLQRRAHAPNAESAAPSTAAASHRPRDRAPEPAPAARSRAAVDRRRPRGPRR